MMWRFIFAMLLILVVHCSLADEVTTKKSAKRGGYQSSLIDKFYLQKLRNLQS
ncbi:unnamed protein product [Cylicocyclus nassatus]|uniref:Uncharacterized protein n=1 Tax=Cylicocyclus nassatus TaxID=53992 RepID=A0AA36H6Q5_CYLNA|nr:unnamed protein product [Cylicocyclus nassatus]